jgi:hypothetical protein
MKEWLKLRLKSKKVKALFLMIVVNFGVFGVASAENGSVNWTQLGDLIKGVGDLMPSIGDLVIKVVPVLFILIMVGFVTGLLDSIVGAIRDAFRFFR